jgi:probable addiction module antidote protein
MNTQKKILEKTGDFQELLVDSLRNKKKAAIYLQVALDEYQQNGNAEVFLLALKNIAQAQGGLGKLAEKTTLNRQYLYRALSSKGNPSLNVLRESLKGLGFYLSVNCSKTVMA